MRDMALVVITDGRREYLTRSVASLREMMRPWPIRRLIVDDSGDLDYVVFLTEACREFSLHTHAVRRGFAGAIETAWKLAIRNPKVRYVFHAEDDFTYSTPVDLERMAGIMDAHPQLAQLALKRQPVNDHERAVGGFMQTWPSDRWDQRDGFVEQRMHFVTNPSLVSRVAIEIALASGMPLSEPNISTALLGLGFTFGYLGTAGDPPRVQHIGEQRMPAWAA